VITTGGLGPTVDDPTREALALAIDVPLEFQPKLWEEIHARIARFGRTPSENSRRMAYIPQGAIPISNPVGTAPAFIVETENSAIISLPGVPAELSVLLETEVVPYLVCRLQLEGMIKARILRTAGIGESYLDERIADLELLSNPTVGLAAHPGRVDIRITAKGMDREEVYERIAEVEKTIRERIGDVIFGTDEETLEGVVSSLLEIKGYKLISVESGTVGLLSHSFTGKYPVYAGGKVFPEISDMDGLEKALRSSLAELEADVGIGILLRPEADHTKIGIHLLEGSELSTISRTYGGAPKNAPLWAASQALAWLRKKLLS
jgi:molybdopterin-biosynthesis enzyme MoeA-like protein